MKPRPSSRNLAHRHLAAHFQIVALRLPTGRPLTSNFHACQFQWSEIRKRHVRTVRGASGGGGPLRHPGGPDRGTTPGRQDHACPEDGGRGPDLRHARRADGATGFIRAAWIRRSSTISSVRPTCCWRSRRRWTRTMVLVVSVRLRRRAL